MAEPLFDAWCSSQEITGQVSVLLLLREKSAAQPQAIELLQGIVPQHYCKPDLVRKWLKKWGYAKALKIVKDDLPQDKKARSGDIGEILAIEYVNRKLDFKVPIFRLRWRDHRELALRGDDVFAVKLDEQGRVHFLKGEAKSRQVLAADVIQEASDALLAHDGRPSPHTINFVVKRLSDLGEDALYEALEDYLTPKRIPKKRVTHLLFALCGNDPEPHLRAHVSAYSGTTQQIVVGFRVKNHANFVNQIYDGVKLA